MVINIQIVWSVHELAWVHLVAHIDVEDERCGRCHLTSMNIENFIKDNMW